MNEDYSNKTKMDFIEFLTIKQKNDYSLALLQASTITSIEAGNEYFTFVETNRGHRYKVVGNYRTVTNRVFYANQSHSIINMAILKPSDFFYHRISELEKYADDIYYSIDFMEKLKHVLESSLFTYRGINTFDK